MATLDTLCIELTTRCPLRCVHCSTFAAPDRGEQFSFQTFKELLGRLGPVQEIYLSGGEPFEHPLLDEFVSFARDYANRVILYSSGVRVDGSRYMPLAEYAVSRLSSLQLARVDLSLYAAQANEHDAVTQTAGSFNATMQTIRVLRAQGVPFGVHFVPLVAEGERVIQVAALARALGASRFHVLAVAPQGRAQSIWAAPTPRFLQKLSEIRGDENFEILRSSALRSAIGAPNTSRDELRAAFVDVHGYVHPSEGNRIAFRRRVGGPPTANEMLRELASLS